MGNIIIPPTVTIIGKDSFQGCTALKSIVIPDSVITIDDGAFNSCSLLEDVVLPKNLEYIKNGTFRDCISLASIVIPNSVINIGMDAFAGTAMSSVKLPASCTYFSTSFPSYCVITGGVLFNDGGA